MDDIHTLALAIQPGVHKPGSSHTVVTSQITLGSFLTAVDVPKRLLLRLSVSASLADLAHVMVCLLPGFTGSSSTGSTGSLLSLLLALLALYWLLHCVTSHCMTQQQQQCLTVLGQDQAHAPPCNNALGI